MVNLRRAVILELEDMGRLAIRLEHADEPKRGLGVPTVDFVDG